MLQVVIAYIYLLLGRSSTVGNSNNLYKQNWLGMVCGHKYNVHSIEYGWVLFIEYTYFSMQLGAMALKLISVQRYQVSAIEAN
mmetsp:Transcript_25148/g.35236  ORF Transcript_25148/g.35236 Transcript_25148/m.35236 type:complete len:83 (-) Transcript_25148:761-1009(-)